MKKALTIGLLLCLASLVWAQAPADQAASAALLAELGKRSQAIQSTQGTFMQQKTIAVLPMPLKSSGKFSFTQGKQVTWETLLPVQSKVLLTPGGIELDNVKGTQQAGVDVIARIFMGVIAGELDSLTAYFVVQAKGESNNWHILLTPVSANLAAYIQTIEIRGKEFTEQLDIAETNGDKTHIRLITDTAVRKPD